MPIDGIMTFKGLFSDFMVNTALCFIKFRISQRLLYFDNQTYC
jgi:hypothetical protein